MTWMENWSVPLHTRPLGCSPIVLEANAESGEARPQNLRGTGNKEVPKLGQQSRPQSTADGSWCHRFQIQLSNYQIISVCEKEKGKELWVQR